MYRNIKRCTYLKHEVVINVCGTPIFRTSQHGIAREQGAEGHRGPREMVFAPSRADWDANLSP